MVETSDDEEKKRLEEVKKQKKEQKGLTETDLNSIIDIELSETQTTWLFFQPGYL